MVSLDNFPISLNYCCDWCRPHAAWRIRFVLQTIFQRPNQFTKATGIFHPMGWRVGRSGQSDDIISGYVYLASNPCSTSLLNSNGWTHFVLVPGRRLAWHTTWTSRVCVFDLQLKLSTSGRNSPVYLIYAELFSSDKVLHQTRLNKSNTMRTTTRQHSKQRNNKIPCTIMHVVIIRKTESFGMWNRKSGKLSSCGSLKPRRIVSVFVERMAPWLGPS